MKPTLVMLLLCVCHLSTVEARALPDSCGKEDTNFKVTAQLNPPPLASPEAGKAQIVFLETENTGGQFINPGDEARIGVDGAWTGATKGDSYFVIAMSPGQHHLCVNLVKNDDSEWNGTAVTSVNVEQGKVYYYRVKILHLRIGGWPTGDTIQSLDLTLVNEDEGKYLINTIALAIAKPGK
jgi:uncharacterized protein (DUF2147 family)